MKSQARPSAPRPLTAKRARSLHRYQTWSPKLKRRISLYIRPSLSVWILIEASPDIEQFCERPGHVQIDRQRVLAHGAIASFRFSNPVVEMATFTK